MTAPRWRRLPTGARRALFRLPLLAYRVGLGAMFGHRLALVTHRGRRTGRERQVVVEVVTRDARTGAVVVASGYGPTANWYRNLRAEPRATLQLGNRSSAVVAVPLSPEEGAQAMADYARRRPRSARMVARQVGVRVDGSEQGYRDLGRVLPYLRLEPDQGMRGGPAG